MLPKFPNTLVTENSDWRNYSETISGRAVPIYCEIESGPNDAQALKRHADSVRAVLRHCFNQNPPATARTVGSTWSFSSIIEPGQVAIDPGNLFHLARIPREHFSATYKARADSGFTPVFVESGTGIGTLNESLGQSVRLALQTSGAGNGHRIGGCISTGTHGSAIGIGALHDTVLALYLLVGPDQAVFVQRGTDSPFAASAATWLEQQTGVPTRHVAADREFHAALVSLGSFGFIFGVVVEATKLYRLEINRQKHEPNDPKVLHAISTLDTSALHPKVLERPYHFDVVMHPYPPDGKKSWFVNLMWKRSVADGVHFESPLPGIPRTTSDTMGLISGLTQKLAGTLLGPLAFGVVREKIFDQLDGDANPEHSTLFPGQVFGPTTLPRGHGASCEIAVDHKRALDALQTVQDTIKAQAGSAIGNLFLGCVAVRFVPKTKALLGMNQFDMNCFIELPSIRNKNVLEVYQAIWSALDQKGIVFTCHWGQLGGFTPKRVEAFFGAHVAAWKAARRELLGNDTAMKVFASTILKEAGLDG